MREKRGMGLKQRILITFVSTILISVILCVILVFLLMRYNIREIGREYGINNPRYEDLYNNTLLISRRMDEEIRILQEQIGEDPAILDDKDQLSAINDELHEVAFLVLTKENAMYFNGSSSISYRQLSEALTLAEESLKDGVFNGETSSGLLVRQVHIQYPDNKEGKLFLISTLNLIAPELRSWLFQTIVLIVAALAITSFLIGRWIYHGVQEPIEELKTATQNIRDGNLDFSVETCGIEELDELCQDFEEMRIRLKESAESKVEVDRQSKELISNITHDLKTPITTIQGYVEGILDGVADTPEKMEHYLLTIRNKSRDIDRLINELTVYSNINTNRIPYNFVRLQVSEYFEDCVEELSMDLEERNIRLDYENLLQRDAVIIADPEQLKRVINNIVGNSVKYADKKDTRIRIRLRDVGDFIQVEIEDNGKGIAQRDLSRVFDRLYRGDASRGSQGGSGIGLSIVKKIIEDHEGKVWATSKEGEGTVIYFVLRKY